MTRRFETKRLPSERTVGAPDGSDVRVLLALPGRGGMAHFELGPGQVSRAVAHHSVDEIWFFLRGRGQMWRRLGTQEDVIDVDAGVCLTIPVGARFQFRANGDGPLSAIGVTMPPWPGEDEAYGVDGPWEPTVSES